MALNYTSPNSIGNNNFTELGPFFIPNRLINNSTHAVTNFEIFTSAQYMGAATLANMMCNITGKKYIFR